MHVNQVRLRRETDRENTNLYELQLAFCEDMTGTEVIESEHIQGNLDQVVHAAERWMSDRTEGYLKPAVRELLLNALTHRNFDSTQCVELLICGNRLEISYQGSLGNDYTAACEAAKMGMTLSLQINEKGVISMLSGGKVKSVSNQYTDLNKNERILMDYISVHGVISNAEARELIHVGTTATRNLLNSLVDKGYLRAEGANRGRKYYLEDKYQK